MFQSEIRSFSLSDKKYPNTQIKIGGHVPGKINKAEPMSTYSLVKTEFEKEKKNNSSAF